ncbi:MAG: NAD-dependent epimerase/dehydratase family protein [Thermoleophilaceae bacterium]
MRVVVTGATGNVGTSVLRSLASEPAVDRVIGLARRLPSLDLAKTEWVAADVATSDLKPCFEGADAVIHLAWLIQPSRNVAAAQRTNVEGSLRVFRAAAAAGVPRLVHASSVGAYSPGPKDRRVDETWPTNGIASSFYARHKAEVERLLDRFEAEHPEIRVVRLRTALVFKYRAASEIRRLFAGPLLPGRLVSPALIPVVPDVERLVFQAVHAHDAGDAYRLAVVDDDARGAFNIAGEPVLDPRELGRLLGARPVRVPASVLRTGAAVSWRLRLQPSPEGWVDMALAVPLMDTTRAREQLGWAPQRSSGDALLELMRGMRDGAGFQTPPLEPGGAGPMRAREFLSGVGAKN